MENYSNKYLNSFLFCDRVYVMAQKNEIKLTDKTLARKARLLAMAGDETRIRILCYLFEGGDPCVSEISDRIGTSIANTSHHLQLMHKSGLLKTQRQGNKICYQLVKGDFTRELKKIICEI